MEWTQLAAVGFNVSPVDQRNRYLTQLLRCIKYQTYIREVHKAFWEKLEEPSLFTASWSDCDMVYFKKTDNDTVNIFTLKLVLSSAQSAKWYQFQNIISLEHLRPIALVLDHDHGLELAHRAVVAHPADEVVGANSQSVRLVNFLRYGGGGGGGACRGRAGIMHRLERVSRFQVWKPGSRSAIVCLVGDLLGACLYYNFFFVCLLFSWQYGCVCL